MCSYALKVTSHKQYTINIQPQPSSKTGRYMSPIVLMLNLPFLNLFCSLSTTCLLFSVARWVWPIVQKILLKSSCFHKKVHVFQNFAKLTY